MRTAGHRLRPLPAPGITPKEGQDSGRGKVRHGQIGLKAVIELQEESPSCSSRGLDIQHVTPTLEWASKESPGRQTRNLAYLLLLLALMPPGYIGSLSSSLAPDGGVTVLSDLLPKLQTPPVDLLQCDLTSLCRLSRQSKLRVRPRLPNHDVCVGLRRTRRDGIRTSGLARS